MLSIVPGVRRFLGIDQQLESGYTPLYPDTCLLLAHLNETFQHTIHEHEDKHSCCLCQFNETITAFHAELKKLKEQL